MNKPFAKSKACAAKTLFAVMKEMQKRGGSIPSSEINPFIEKHVNLTEWEKERAGKLQYFRWYASMQFYSIDYKVAGFLLKKNGNWYLTPEGDATIALGAEEVMNKANYNVLTVLPAGQPEDFRFSGRSSPPEGLRGGLTSPHQSSVPHIGMQRDSFYGVLR